MKRDNSIEIGFPKEFKDAMGSICGEKCFAFGEGDNYRISHGSANFLQKSIRMFCITNLFSLDLEISFYEGTVQYIQFQKFHELAKQNNMTDEITKKALESAIKYAEKQFLLLAYPEQLNVAIKEFGKQMIRRGRNSLRRELDTLFQEE